LGVEGQQFDVHDSQHNKGAVGAQLM
jgi:hypothetical protein